MRMTCRMLLFMGMLIGVFLTARASVGADSNAEYVIGQGDVLVISLWKDDALTKEVTVLPDGTITFPLVGEIQASGKKISTLKKDIESKIKRYVPDPVLTIMVKVPSSMSFYVIGRVNKPGQYPLVGSLNVIQGLAIAGGPTPFASTSGIKILRAMGDSTMVMMFDYDDVAKGKHLEQNITIKRGDVIIVP